MEDLPKKGFRFFVLPPMVFLLLLQMGAIILASVVARLPFLDHSLWLGLPFLIVFFAVFFCYFKVISPKGPGFILLAVFITFWGYYGMARVEMPETGQFHVRHFCNGKTYKINGRISSFSRHFPNKAQVVLDQIVLSPISGKNSGSPGIPEKNSGQGQDLPASTQTSPIRVTGKILCNIYQAQHFSGVRGDRLEFTGALKKIRNFSNPKGFDYHRFLLRKHIWGSTYTHQGKFLVSPDSDPTLVTRVATAVEGLRNRFFFYLQDTLEDSSSAAIISALVTGKKEMLSHHLRDDFSKAGVSHLLAISGLHMAILATVFWWIFFLLFSIYPKNLISGKARKMAGVCALFPLLGYAVFVGFSPSTQRAFLMTLVFMAAILADRENMPMNTLALAGVVILGLYPSSLFSISFQLSFTAVSSILLGMEVMRKRNWFLKKSKLAGFLLNSCLVSFLAGIGTAPLIIGYFNMISLVQVPANLILIPLMGMICLPLGLIGMVLFMIQPGLAHGPILLCGELVESAISMVHFFVDIPFSWTRMVSLSVWEITLFYGFLAWALLFFCYPNHRRRLWAFGLFLLLVLMGDGIFVYKTYLFPEHLSVVVLDVGQGNAALIRTPSRERILVDGGGFPTYGKKDTGFDVGRHIVGPYLWGQKIMSLDAVVMSHPDGDHINGLVFILENFRVGKLIKNRDDNTTHAYKQIMKICREKNIPVMVPGCGKNLTQAFSQMSMKFFECQGKIQEGSLNDHSLVFQLQLGKFTMLFPGDILAKREKHLAEVVGNLLHSQVLLCPHHGSASSSRSDFLDKVAPESVIISCGYNNRYKFPHPQVLERYNKRNIKVFRTDLDGAITVICHGRTYAISTIVQRL